MTHDVSGMLKILQSRIVSELKRKYPDYITDEPLIFAMQDILRRQEDLLSF